MPPFEVPSDFIAQFQALRQQVADLGVKVASIPREVSGKVASDGSESSADFSVTHGGTGDYTVTFAAPFPAAPDVIVGIGGDPVVYVSKIYGGTAPTTTGFRVSCHNAGTPTDGAFTFIARQGA